MGTDLQAFSENGYEFRRLDLKMDFENDIFLPEIGSGFEGRGGTTAPKIIRSALLLTEGGGGHYISCRRTEV